MKKVKILALVSAVVLATLLYIFLSALRSSSETETVTVLTAAADIPANIPITANMLQQTELPKEAVLSNAISASSEVVGTVSRTEIYQGEQILSSKLVAVGEGDNETLAYTIEPGMRAITIAVDATSGLSNMIAPGNHVDIIGDFLTEKTDTNSKTQKQSYTVMVLENIEVLAVDNILSKDQQQDSETAAYQTITLQVTPEQAMKLSMAQFEGELRAILRSPLDETDKGLRSITLDDILH